MVLGAYSGSGCLDILGGSDGFFAAKVGILAYVRQNPRILWPLQSGLGQILGPVYGGTICLRV